MVYQNQEIADYQLGRSVVLTMWSPLQYLCALLKVRLFAVLIGWELEDLPPPPPATQSPP